MPGDTLYGLLKHTLDVTIWGGEIISTKDVPRTGAAVYVANHAGAIGPIGVAASLPVRLYPWVIGDMLDPERAGPYLRQDFLEPELHLPRSMAAPISQALSKITVPLLRRLGCIPVWHDRDLLETYRISAEHLEAGHVLLIFPEDPNLPLNIRTGMRPFKTGFAHLGSLFSARMQRSLQFFPLAVRRTSRRIQLGEAVCYNPLNADAVERRRVARTLEASIAAMLAEGGDRLGVGVREPT